MFDHLAFFPHCIHERKTKMNSIHDNQKIIDAEKEAKVKADKEKFESEKASIEVGTDLQKQIDSQLEAQPVEQSQ